MCRNNSYCFLWVEVLQGKNREELPYTSLDRNYDGDRCTFVTVKTGTKQLLM